MNHLTERDCAAFGSAVIACTKLENLLMLAFASKRSHEQGRQIEEGLDQGHFVNAVRMNLSDLCEDALKRLKNSQYNVDEVDVLEQFFQKNRDSRGKEISCSFVIWRNTLCHGLVSKGRGEEIHIEFTTRSTFSYVDSSNRLIDTGISKNTSADELLTLAKSIHEMCGFLSRAFIVGISLARDT